MRQRPTTSSLSSMNRTPGTLNLEAPVLASGPNLGILIIRSNAANLGTLLISHASLRGYGTP